MESLSFLKDPTEYARLYIISSCMSPNDVKYKKGKVTKLTEWAKAQSAKLELFPSERVLTLGTERYDLSNAKEFSVVDMKGDKSAHFLLITFDVGNKKEYLSISSHIEYLHMLNAACHFANNMECTDEIVEQKVIDCKKLISDVAELLLQDEELAPPDVPEPPNLDFLQEDES